MTTQYKIDDGFMEIQYQKTSLRSFLSTLRQFLIINISIILKDIVRDNFLIVDSRDIDESNSTIFIYITIKILSILPIYA